MNSKPKLLYLVTLSESGGAQTYVLNLTTSLKGDFDITVASGGKSEDWLPTKLKNDNISWVELKNIQRSINPLKDLAGIFEIRKLIKQIRPDIIHSNSSKVSILGGLAALGFSARKIYTAHGWVFLEPIPWPVKILYLWAEKITALFKDKIICVSEYDRAAARTKHFPRHKLITIHNGIDTKNIKFLSKQEARQKINTKYFIPDTRYLIGTIANLYRTKNLLGLISAADKLVNNDWDCSFVVIGEGPERKNLELKIENQGLKNNFFLVGRMENARQYLPAFNVFVLPSVKEGLPYTLLEAMLAGLPIVATRVGGMFEILEFYPQSHYRLVVAGDDQALTGALAEMLKQTPLEDQQLESVKDNIDIGRMVAATKEVYLN